MADTQRTIAALLALLADNTTGDISAQDVRDLVATLRASHGELAVVGPAAVTIGVADTWYEVNTGSWSLSGDEHEFDSSAAGRLRYTGANPRLMHVAASVSFSLDPPGANDVIHIAVGKNGTALTRSVAQRLVSTGGDVGSTALHVAPLLSNGDYLSLLVKNADAAEDVTFEGANLFAMGMAT